VSIELLRYGPRSVLETLQELFGMLKRLVGLPLGSGGGGGGGEEELVRQESEPDVSASSRIAGELDAKSLHNRTPSGFCKSYVSLRMGAEGIIANQ
jgi:hypothetical protein